MKFDIKSVKPKNVKVSDKYSANLYRFLKKNEHWGISVFAPQWSMIDGSFKEFDFDDPNCGEIYIGFRDDFGWLVGNRLSHITCGMRGYLESYCYAPGDGSFYKNMIEITDWFYSEYKEKGRALWDVSGSMRMVGDEDRFTVIGNTKRCNWSGRWYHKEVVKRQKTDRTDKWVMEVK